MRQLIHTSLLLIIMLCFTFGERKICSTIKVSKYYEHDCLENFILLFMSLLTALIVKGSHFLAGIYFIFFFFKVPDQTWKDFNTKFGPQWNGRQSKYEVRQVLKLVSAIFYQIFISHQMVALQNLWKMLFISSKKLFFVLKIFKFLYFGLPLFLPVSHCFRGWSKINLEVYDVIKCLNKNLKHILLGILRRKKGMRLKLCPLIKY